MRGESPRAGARDRRGRPSDDPHRSAEPARGRVDLRRRQADRPQDAGRPRRPPGRPDREASPRPRGLCGGVQGDDARGGPAATLSFTLESATGTVRLVGVPRQATAELDDRPVDPSKPHRRHGRCAQAAPRARPERAGLEDHRGPRERGDEAGSHRRSERPMTRPRFEVVSAPASLPATPRPEPAGGAGVTATAILLFAALGFASWLADGQLPAAALRPRRRGPRLRPRGRSKSWSTGSGSSWWPRSRCSPTTTASGPRCWRPSSTRRPCRTCSRICASPRAPRLLAVLDGSGKVQAVTGAVGLRQVDLSCFAAVKAAFERPTSDIWTLPDQVQVIGLAPDPIGRPDAGPAREGAGARPRASSRRWRRRWGSPAPSSSVIGSRRRAPRARRSTRRFGAPDGWPTGATSSRSGAAAIG